METAGVEFGFGQVARILKKGGTFMICNESDGTDAAGIKYEKIIEGMKAYAKRQIGRHAYFSVLYLDPNTMPAIWYSDSRKFEAYSYYMFTNVYCADYGSMKLYYQIVKNAIRPKSLTEEEALAITRKTKAVQVPIYALTAKNIEKYVK